MRPVARAVSGLALLAVISCGSTTSPESIVCNGTASACECDHVYAPDAGTPSACSPASIPDAVCCAGSSWPSSGSCVCSTSDIFCGLVIGYEPAADGGPGEDACVCSSDASLDSQQVVGATCYPNGTTTPGDGLGACCMFPVEPAGEGYPAACVCGAGLHTCAAGGTPVPSCSASNFTAVPQSCESGDQQVASCSQ